VSSLAIDIRRQRLDNGLELAVVPLPHLHTVTIVVAVRVGSRYESAANNGISHVLEHMLFRGTAAYPSAFEFNLAVEELGGTLLATTQADVTTYELTLPPEHAAEGIAIVAGIFGPPSLRNLDLEKRIVREEILDGIDEDGHDVDADDLAIRALFGTHPLGFKIAGTEACLDRFDDASLRAWHAQHYVASNAVVVVAGAVDAAEIASVVSRRFGGIAPGARRMPAPAAAPIRGPRLSHIDGSGSQTDVRIVLPSVGETDPRLPGIGMLARILDDGMSTRLFRTIVEDTGLAYDAFGGHDAYEDVGVFVVGAAIEHRKTPTLVSTALEMLVQLRDGAIDPRELAKAKTRATFELRASLDAAAAIAEALAIDRAFGFVRGLEELAQRVEAVTLDDLAIAARQTIRPEHLQVVTVGMLSEGIERETRKIVQAFR
jgi:predicted Zn-dependent peptidase